MPRYAGSCWSGMRRDTGPLNDRSSVPVVPLHISLILETIGISFKTQALYLTVFLTRYVDLLTGPWISAYNTIMKIFFIGSSAYILWLMKFKFR